MTNREWLESLSNRELAEILDGISGCGGTGRCIMHDEIRCPCDRIEICVWLNKERKDDKQGIFTVVK